MSREPTDIDAIRQRRRADTRSRRWRWFRRVAITLVLGFVSFLTWQTILWYQVRGAGEHHLQAVVAELDATDPDWRLDRLMSVRNRSLPPFEMNAAEQAFRAASLVPKSVRLWQRQIEWRTKLKPNELPHTDDLADVRKNLLEAKDAIDAARAVSRFPSGGFAITPAEPDPHATQLDQTQEMRLNASLLDFDAMVRAYDRDGDGAIESCQSILATGRGIGDEPTSISMLVRIAVATVAVRSAERTLGYSECSDGRLREIQIAFSGETEVPRFAYGIRGDRAVMHRYIENFDNGSLMLEEGHSAPRGQTFWEMVVCTPHRARIPEQQAIFLEFMNRFLVAAKMPHGPARRSEIDSIVLAIRAVPKDECPLLFLFPALQRVAEADTRIVSLLRSTSVALACERFRLKSGRFPKALEELPKDLLSAIPLDPYTGRSILYRLTDTGAVVYCVGPDETDDEGELDPTPKPGFDIGFQLFAPEHRRKPPQPKPATDHP